MNPQHLIDLKSSVACLVFMLLPSAGTTVDWGIKILGFLIYAGYHARRWWLLEQSKNKTEND